MLKLSVRLNTLLDIKGFCNKYIYYTVSITDVINRRRGPFNTDTSHHNGCTHTVNVSSGDRHVVDLRTDTLTVPTPAMYDAMINAAVGNDVYHEDPTVNELEKRCAKLLGKEAAVYVPTGTMGNLLAIMVHCEGLGSELLVGDKSHIYLCEQGGASQFAHAHVGTLTNLPDGTFDIAEMKAKIRKLTNFYHQPESKLICLENTHNVCGGKVIPLDFLEKVYNEAKSSGLAVHMDGSRIWHAAVALDIDITTASKFCDSLNVCFSKGMGCPVGSLVAGTQTFIDRCRRSRKALGGGMRQVGVLAGAAMFALDNVYPLLKDDHRRAKTLANGIIARQHGPVSIDIAGVHTNMVRVDFNELYDVSTIIDRLKQVTEKEQEVLGESISLVVSPSSQRSLRFVTYLGITDDDIDKAIRKCNFVFNEIFSKLE